MIKYDPLGAYLSGRDASQTPMTFDEIECVIGAPLPPAAGRYPAWWSNNPSNNVMTKVWLDAGYRSERVDLGARKLVFRRSRPALALAWADATASDTGRGLSVQIQGPSIFSSGCARVLADRSRSRQGSTLAAPTDEIWDAEVS